MPVYGDAAYLDQSLGSVLRQSLEDIEVICVDDASGDGSSEILAGYAARDPRIKLIRHKRNLGALRARKDGVLASSGEFIMFLDGDDELVPAACETAFGAIRRCQTDVVEFDTEVVNCSDMPQSRIDGNQRRLKPHLGRVEGDGLVEACWKDKLFSFNLWNKIYEGGLCRMAFSQMEDILLPKAQDLCAFFAIACFAKFYEGIDERLYRYNFGRGVTGGNSLSLERFDVLLSEKQTAEALRRFAAAQGADGRYASILDDIERHFLGECVASWHDYLGPESLSAGFDRLIEVWGFEDVLCTLAEKYWDDQAVLEEKLLRTNCFRCAKRPSGKKLTVAYYYRCVSNGGAQRVAAELCNLWAAMEDARGEACYRVVLICDEGPQEDEYPLDPRVQREFLPERLESSKGRYRARYRAWQRILEEDSIDVVVSGQWVDVCTLWDLLSVKSHPSRPAFILHDHNFIVTPSKWAGDSALRILRQDQLCDGVVTLSECDESFAKCFCANAKYIPNTLDYVVGNSCGDVSSREEHSIVWAGRFSTEKRPLDLVLMMGELVKLVPDAKLYLVGGGEEDKELETSLRDAAARLGLEDQIVFIGFTLDVDVWYRKASVAVCTSELEGFPMTIAEELSFSLPIVMYDLPWLSFVKDGRGIETVEQGCYGLMASKVADLLEHPEKARRLGAEGRTQIDDAAGQDVGALWQEVFEGIDPDAKPAAWDSDERILLQYLVEYQESAKRGLRGAKRAAEKKAAGSEASLRAARAENKKLAAEIERLRSSTTWKVGRALTWLPRKIKHAVRARKKGRQA